MDTFDRLDTPIHEVFGDDTRLCNYLEKADILTMGHLLYTTQEELSEIPGVGEKVVEKVVNTCTIWVGR